MRLSVQSVNGSRVPTPEPAAGVVHAAGVLENNIDRKGATACSNSEPGKNLNLHVRN